MRILLTDGQQRKTLACARALGSRGHGVWIGDETRCSMSSFSRFCTRRVVYPNPTKHPKSFAEALGKTVGDDDIGIVVPMDDASMEALYDSGITGSLGGASVILPPQSAFRSLRDKLETVKTAKAAGVGVPESLELLPGVSGIGIYDAAGILGYPFVVKPRRGSGGRGFSVIEDAAGATALQASLPSLTGRYGPMMAQAFVAGGELVDACVLMDAEGRVRASFAQREVRHFPLRGGTSTVQESVSAPELVEATASLLRSIGWVGVAESEFMVDPVTGTATLLEVNPRFWASLQLAIDCGVDFPNLLVDMATGSPLPETPPDYRVGRMARWSLPGDILHFMANPGRFRMNPGFLDLRAAKDDIAWASDPGPILGFALACLRYSVDPAMWRMLLRR